MSRSGKTRPKIRLVVAICSGLALILATVISVQLLPSQQQPADRKTSAGALSFGVLGSTCDADRAVSLHKAGVQVAQLDIEWSKFEPAKGQYSADYVSELNTNLGNCAAAGLTVSLGLGLSSAPSWVSDLPDGRYINQYGDSYSGHTPNIVFSKDVRASYASYVAKLFELLKMDSISSIRVGTGQAGELGYPSAQNAPNSFWAYSDAAQTGGDLPTDVQPTPLPGWTPGAQSWRGATISPQQVDEWFSWYSGEVAKAVTWQIKLVRALGYDRQFILPLAGRGALPADLTLAIAAGLNGTADRDGSLESGLYYPSQLRYIASTVGTEGMSADVTGLDDATAVDARSLSPPQDACQDGDSTADLAAVPNADQWSTTRWTVANARQAGLDVVGENPGSPGAPGTGGHSGSDDLRAQMLHAPQYAAVCNLSAMYWAFEDDLFGDPSVLSLADYMQAIKEFGTP